MESGKPEMPGHRPESTGLKKRRRRKLIVWLAVDLAVAGLILGLLLYRPGRYRPLSAAFFRPGQVSPYLTHLTAEIYNGAQLGEQFEVVLTEEGINDIIARWDGWPLAQGGVLLYEPAVVLVPGRLVLMGTANARGMELVVTIEVEPKLEENGLLRLRVAKVKVGAVNTTLIAKAIAAKMYSQRLSEVQVDTGAWQSRLAGSLLNDEAFEPVFPASIPNLDDEIVVRLLDARVEKGRLVLRLLPRRPGGL